MFWTAGLLNNRVISLEMSPPIIILTIAAVVAIVALAVVALRVIILLPAVAVDAPGAIWGRAMADSKGNAWRVFVIFLLAFLPLAVAGTAATGLTVFVIDKLMGRGDPAILTLAAVLAILFGIIRT